MLLPNPLPPFKTIHILLIAPSCFFLRYNSWNAKNRSIFPVYKRRCGKSIHMRSWHVMHPLVSSKRPAMPDLPTGTLTLLFTDMEGSTRLVSFPRSKPWIAIPTTYPSSQHLSLDASRKRTRSVGCSRARMFAC